MPHLRKLKRPKMNEITYFTKVQKEVEDWITEMGFKVRAEVDVEQYRADLAIWDLEMIVEVDGPSHRKLKERGKLVKNDGQKVTKRDALMLAYYPNGVWHVPVDISEDTFKDEFKKIIEGLEKKE